MSKFKCPERYAGQTTEKTGFQLQNELNAAQLHLRRFAQMFREVAASVHGVGNLPEPDPMKVRPVSPVGLTPALPGNLLFIP